MIAPRKYVQGRGLLSSLGRYVAELGEDALVVADQTVWGLVREEAAQSFARAGVRLIEDTFGGECSRREIQRLQGVAEREAASVILGVGGGKAMDTAKAVGHEAGVKWASVPTIVSTDTPTSALAVVYTDGGVFEEYMLLPRNPDLVLVDTQVAANAPVRFFVAGMGDALATWVEARAAAKARKTAMAGGAPTMAALALARLCWDTLFAYGVSARQAAEQHVVTPAVENHSPGAGPAPRLRATETKRKELSWPSVTGTSRACRAGSTPPSPTRMRLLTSTAACSGGSSRTRCPPERRAGI